MQLLRGLKYFHSVIVIHMDLKPENLFVNDVDCKLKIDDFGLARSMTRSGRGMSSYIVTQWHRAPELLVCSDRYDTSIDMWPAGCILTELLRRRPFFPGNNDINQLERIVNVLGVKGNADFNYVGNEHACKYIKSLPQSLGVPFASIYPNANPLAIDLLKMLIFDPSKRMSLRHFDLGFDDDVEEDTIREMMWEEMLFYHQEGEVTSRDLRLTLLLWVNCEPKHHGVPIDNPAFLFGCIDHHCHCCFTVVQPQQCSLQEPANSTFRAHFTNQGVPPLVAEFI
ncbi:hypothetical protein ZIOFF_073678 [Zingiber officinale]|uniref:Protein kinase domain-containing protein n=1 Tax=Zingiber officinale TaxID=94328 RepID=A0A8J5BYY6_ZINOF|nr:hypothetical protein ZIOFF_073678 [Zingiber officinale]